MAVSHAKLLAKNCNFAILTIADEYRALGRSNHDLRILTLVNETLRDVIVNVELAIIAVVNCEVFAGKLPRVAEQKFSLLFSEQKLSVSCPLGCSVLIVPGVFFLCIPLCLHWRM